ncbi:MAG TPA: hypothetical protein VF791_04460 [Pyrinomonadaceae bacterium]
MHWLRWTVIVLALFVAGWMTFDGARALIAGDYVTPKSGEHAGQLGPWAKAVSIAGIKPRSVLMKTIFVVYGAAWLLMILCYALNLPWARWAMLLAAAGSLWYLWVGTISGLIQITLLLFTLTRGAAD